MNQHTASFDVEKSPTRSFLLNILALCRYTSLLQLSFVSLAALAAAIAAFSLQQVFVLRLAPVFLGCVLFVAFTAWFLIKTKSVHGRLSMDKDLSGIQKSHKEPVPRIGGVAIFLGLLCIIGVVFSLTKSVDLSKASEFLSMAYLLLLCGFPAFCLGLAEDLTKQVSVASRLLATLCSGLAAAWFLGAVVHRLDVPFLDPLMTFAPLVFLVSATAVAGIANAVNIIDGFNGLAGGSLVIVSGAFALLAASVGDTTLVLLSITLMSLCFGFLIFNFPKGQIFLGDGGAYFLGFLLGELGVFMIARHPDISCWTVLTLIGYPVIEVLVSMVRRKYTSAGVGQPDRGHLHQRLQELLVHAMSVSFGRLKSGINEQVSPLVWLLNIVFVALGLLFSFHPIAAPIGFFLGLTTYLCIYVGVCRFNNGFANRTSYPQGLLYIESEDAGAKLGRFEQSVDGANSEVLNMKKHSS